MNDPKIMNTAAAGAADIDVGLRSYMLGVYNYMTTALAVTGLFAIGIKMLAVDTNSAGQLYYTGLGQLIYGSPLKWVVFLAPLGMVFYMSAAMRNMKLRTAQTMFYVFSALMGISLASILWVYTGASVARVFFITAGAFAGLSLYGYTTKRDLSPIGAFLVMGVIGLLLAMIVNVFLQSQGFELLISIGGVLLFAGLTAYDTQRIKSMYMVSDGHEVAQKKSIFGALTLYLDFINMFLFLLRLMGNRQ
jgi:FtsH-binding integral membrane protein